MIITIDGPAGSGKSTAARRLAETLGIAFLDTGATYRAVTLKAMREKADMSSEAALADVARRADIHLEGPRVLLDGRDVSGEIRTEAVTEQSQHVARAAAARAVLVKLQRRLGEQIGSFVAEGRDQGSVVFPGADAKFFLDASCEVRAQRRFRELTARGEKADYGQVLSAIVERDRRDRTRAVAPLVAPDGAVRIDTSEMTIDEVVAELRRHVEGRR